MVEVVAAPELLVEIRCADAKHLARVAWHIGNRHVPVQVLSNALRIRRDHVLADLAGHLGADVVEIEAPFIQRAAHIKARIRMLASMSNTRPLARRSPRKRGTQPGVSFARE